MESRKNIMAVILLLVYFNLYAGYFAIESGTGYDKNYYNGDPYLESTIETIGGKELTIYRTNHEVINYQYSNPFISTSSVYSDLPKKYKSRILFVNTTNVVKNMAFYNKNALYITGDYHSDSVVSDGYGYGYDYSGNPRSTVQTSLKAFLEIQIPADLSDGSYTIGKVLSMSSYGTGNPGVLSVESEIPIGMTLITIPSISMVSSSIDFGKLNTDSNSDKIAYGMMRIENNESKTTSFTATYPTTINLTNITDSTTVPMNIDLVGEPGGSSLGNNFQITGNKIIYTKATLPGSSIYNKSIGTYTGSVTISISTN